jgi:hypothetical protein
MVPTPDRTNPFEKNYGKNISFIAKFVSAPTISYSTVQLAQFDNCGHLIMPAIQPAVLQ